MRSFLGSRLSWRFCHLLLCSYGYIFLQLASRLSLNLWLYDANQLKIAEQAQALIERGRQVQWQFGRRLLEGIPEEDLATMRRCLERMDGNLNGICKEKR